MTHGTWGALLAGLALLAASCGRPAPGVGSQAGGGDEPGGAAPAPRAGSDAAVGLPPSHFDGVPGWLGFVVRPVDQRQRGWTPAHPRAGVAIVDAEAWVERAREGTRFRLVTREGNLPLALSEVSRVPYGCEANERVMAAFRTPSAPAEQLVWILPDGAAAATAAAVPVIAGPIRKQRRSWMVGSLAIQVQLAGKLDGRLEVRAAGASVLGAPFQKPAMEGADMAPLDLTRELEIGVPYVEAAFRLGPALTIVALRTVTYEGVSFEVLALGDSKLERAGSRYVALCAF